jgi:beta-lactamase regulating signal transducer with metallopeptidase domain
MTANISQDVVAAASDVKAAVAAVAPAVATVESEYDFVRTNWKSLSAIVIAVFALGIIVGLLV